MITLRHNHQPEAQRNRGLSFLILLYMVSATGVYAQMSGTSETVGFLQITLKGKNATSSGDNFVAPSFVGIREFTGLSKSGPPVPFSIQATVANWESNQFDLHPTRQSHYVEILASNNPQAIGLCSGILSHSSDTLSIIEDYSGVLVGGETITIRKYLTLNYLFGASNEAGLDGGSSNNADMITVLMPGATPSQETFYYRTSDNTQRGWRSINEPTVDKGDWPIPRNAGLYIRRISETDLNVYFTGAVKSGPDVIVIEQGLNLIDPHLGILGTSESSKAFTLGTSNFGTPSELDSILHQGISSRADLLSIHDGEFSFRTYYVRDAANSIGGNGWRLTNDPLTSQEGTTIGAGSALLINNKGERKQWVRPEIFPQGETF